MHSLYRGVVFLMETAKIEDMIINTVALAFILSQSEDCTCILTVWRHVEIIYLVGSVCGVGARGELRSGKCARQSV